MEETTVVTPPPSSRGCLVEKTTFPLSLGGGGSPHREVVVWLGKPLLQGTAQAGGLERQLITRVERGRLTQSYTPSSLPPILIGGRGRNFFREGGLLEPLLPKAASKGAEQLSREGRALAQPPSEAGGLADRPLQPPDWRLLKGRAIGASTP